MENILLMRGERDNKVYICSPLRGADWIATQRNMIAARYYMYLTWVHTHRYPRAPHAYLPLLFCEDKPGDRYLARHCRMVMLSQSTEVFVCGSRLTEEMREEINHAMNLGKPITVFHQAVYDEVRMHFRRKQRDKNLLVLNTDPRHDVLGLSADELFDAAEEVDEE